MVGVSGIVDVYEVVGCGEVVDFENWGCVIVFDVV